MKTYCFTFFLILILPGLAFRASAQSNSGGDDCQQLWKVIYDAQNEFKEYEGELIYDEDFETGYEYDLILFDDEGSTLRYMFDMGELIWVEFYYTSSKDINTVKNSYQKILNKLDGCLSGSYFKSKDKSDYAILYQEFTDNRDAGADYASYPQVELSIQEDNEGYYYAMITIYAVGY
jgi:hypothetical protein